MSPQDTTFGVPHIVTTPRAPFPHRTQFQEGSSSSGHGSVAVTFFGSGEEDHATSLVTDIAIDVPYEINSSAAITPQIESRRIRPSPSRRTPSPRRSGRGGSTRCP